MRRELGIVVALVAVGVTASGCGMFGEDTVPGDTAYHVTGEAGATIDVTRTSAAPAGQPGPATEKDSGVALPFDKLLVLEPGDTTITAVPSKGALTCWIVVEGKEVVRVAGQPGKPVTCTAKIGG